jgi:small-conductance mechanosensitive channel
MDYERTAAPHNSPSPLRPSPLDWLLRLRLRAGGSKRAGVLVGAGLFALAYAILTALLGVLALGTAGGEGWLAGTPRTGTGPGTVVALFLSDATGALAVGVMVRRQAVLTAGLTGLVLHLPRLVAARGPAPLPLPARDLGPLVGLLLGGLGLTILSVGMWAAMAALGAVLATRRLAGLGLS